MCAFQYPSHFQKQKVTPVTSVINTPYTSSFKFHGKLKYLTIEEILQ